MKLVCKYFCNNRFNKFIADKISLNKNIDINWDELSNLIPVKTKSQLYSKYQKSKKVLEMRNRFKCESKLKTKVAKFKHELNNSLKKRIQGINTISPEKNNIISFSCAENNEILPIDGDFLKMLIQLNNNNAKNSSIILNLDENVFENVFSILSMEKYYKYTF